MPPEKKQNLNPTEEIQSLRTYKSDVAEFIKREGKTLADIAIAENSRQSNALKEEADRPKTAKKALYIIVAIVALIGISTLVFWLTLKLKPDTASTVVTNTEEPSLFVSNIKEKTVSIQNQGENGTLSTLGIALKESNPFLVLQIDFEKTPGEIKPISSRDFLEKIGVYPPSDLVRSLTERFAIGSIAGKSRFLILKNNYYSGAFAGMLGWEKDIINNLRDLLDLPPAKSSNVITTTIGTTTIISQITQSQFKDSIVANRDARVFKDGSGTTILLYLFPDNDTIVISSNENTAKIVTEKLLRSGSK